MTSEPFPEKKTKKTHTHKKTIHTRHFGLPIVIKKYVKSFYYDISEISDFIKT